MAGGFALSIGSVCLIVFYGYIRLFGNPAFWGQLPAGWTEIILLLSLFSGVILFSLGIIAEYLWRIYEEVKNRPGYIICEKQNELDNNSFPLK
jgi:dolichol-phosphate mannosyltransferase